MRLSTVIATACAAAALALPAAHAESTSSAASSAASASIGSVSDSVQGSSRSSGGQRVAQGDYRIVEVLAQAQPDGRLRLTLQGQQDRFDLLLPPSVAERAGLGLGVGVRVAHEPYGLAFTRAGQTAAFFLALEGAWRHELESRVVTL